MVVDAILTVLLAPLAWLLGLLPSWTPPDWLVGQAGCNKTLLECHAFDVGQYAGAAQGWVPIQEVVVVVQAVFLALGVALAIRLVRMVVSAVTGGGGNA